MHPHVELYHQPRTMEMTYFRTNETYAKGDDWFVNEMPCSYSNQITIMKDSQYFDYPYPVAERIQKFNSSIKLILIGTYSPSHWDATVRDRFAIQSQLS